MNQLDVSKVGALRVAGWSWRDIARALDMAEITLRRQWRNHCRKTDYERWAAKEDQYLD